MHLYHKKDDEYNTATLKAINNIMSSLQGESTCPNLTPQEARTLINREHPQKQQIQILLKKLKPNDDIGLTEEDANDSYNPPDLLI